jgi:hypothetical protein
VSPKEIIAVLDSLLNKTYMIVKDTMKPIKKHPRVPENDWEQSQSYYLMLFCNEFKGIVSRDGVSTEAFGV